MRFLKNALALVGLGLAVAGQRLDSSRLVYAAIGCLVAALMLRLLLRRQA